jgi:hypothetical protein
VQEQEDEGAQEDEKVDTKTLQLPMRKNIKPQTSSLDAEYEEIRKIELMYEKEVKMKEI